VGENHCPHGDPTESKGGTTQVRFSVLNIGFEVQLEKSAIFPRALREARD
jgi:hypothetical protein